MPTLATSSLSFCDILKGDYIVMLENRFKTKLIEELEEMFPGCIVVHLDPNEIQGIPDSRRAFKYQGCRVVAYGRQDCKAKTEHHSSGRLLQVNVGNED